MTGNVTFTGGNVGENGLPKIHYRYLIEVCASPGGPMPFTATIYGEVGGGTFPAQRVFYAPNWETAFAKIITALKGAGNNADQTMTINLHRTAKDSFE